jgi:hypothetical protein
MEIETVDDLVEQLADWFGVYGGCKNNEEDENCESKCKFDPKRPFCCRNGFQSVMGDRIRDAVNNEKKLEALEEDSFEFDLDEPIEFKRDKLFRTFVLIMIGLGILFVLSVYLLILK